MEDSSKRFTNKPTHRTDFWGEFLVHCPKCSKEAVVLTAKKANLDFDKLVCNHCLFVKSSKEFIKYRANISKNCPNCGKKQDIDFGVSKSIPKTKKTTCVHCNFVESVIPKIEIVYYEYKNKGCASDPIFNLPLWFQAKIKNDTFWAYNRKHLNEIKDYVDAKLRERSNTGYSTMVERLPTFIKLAKNREQILKEIERLNNK